MLLIWALSSLLSLESYRIDVSPVKMHHEFFETEATYSVSDVSGDVRDVRTFFFAEDYLGSGKGDLSLKVDKSLNQIIVTRQKTVLAYYTIERSGGKIFLNNYLPNRNLLSSVDTRERRYEVRCENQVGGYSVTIENDGPRNRLRHSLVFFLKSI